MTINEKSGEVFTPRRLQTIVRLNMDNALKDNLWERLNESDLSDAESIIKSFPLTKEQRLMLLELI